MIYIEWRCDCGEVLQSKPEEDRNDINYTECKQCHRDYRAITTSFSVIIENWEDYNNRINLGG